MVYTVQSTASFTTVFAELYGVYLVYSSMWANVEPSFHYGKSSRQRCFL